MTKEGVTQRKILRLMKKKNMCASDLAKRLNLARSGITKHIKNLEAVGAIERAPEQHTRKWKYYRLVAQAPIDQEMNNYA